MSEQLGDIFTSKDLVELEEDFPEQEIAPSFEEYYGLLRTRLDEDLSAIYMCEPNAAYTIMEALVHNLELATRAVGESNTNELLSTSDGAKFMAGYSDFYFGNSTSEPHRQPIKFTSRNLKAMRGRFDVQSTKYHIGKPSDNKPDSQNPQANW